MSKFKMVSFKNRKILSEEGFQPSIEKLVKGLKTLHSLWKKGLVPRDLRRHFLLTWFAFSKGNIMKEAKILDYNRNQLINLFGREKLGRRTYRLRNLWLKIRSKNPKISFRNSFSEFFLQVARSTVFTRIENKNLINLWLMGFPEEVLYPHYVLCSFREGLKRKQVCQKLGLSSRTVHRIKYSSLPKNSLANTWLYPLEPKLSDWYPDRSLKMNIDFRNELMKSDCSIRGNVVNNGKIKKR